MNKLKDFVLVIDVESTCWEPKSSQPADEISEIIEIGISVVNTKELEIVKNSSIIIKPQRSTISEFCTQLTTITSETVSSGISYESAVDLLRKDYQSNKTTFISWGDYDRKMFEKNCKDYNVVYPFGPRHLNLKNIFSIFNNIDKEVGLDYAVKYYNLPFEGTHHRADSDAYNTAKVFICMLKQFRQAL